MKNHVFRVIQTSSLLLMMGDTRFAELKVWMDGHGRRPGTYFPICVGCQRPATFQTHFGERLESVHALHFSHFKH